MQEARSRDQDRVHVPINIITSFTDRFETIYTTSAETRRQFCRQRMALSSGGQGRPIMLHGVLGTRPRNLTRRLRVQGDHTTIAQGEPLRILAPKELVILSILLDLFDDASFTWGKMLATSMAPTLQSLEF